MTEVANLLDPVSADEMKSVAIEDFLRETFRQLNASGLRYTIPRNWHDLPRHVGKDLDILLPARELWSAVELIRLVASRLGLASVVYREDGQGLGLNVFPLLEGSPPTSVSFDLRTYLSFRTYQSTSRGMTYKVFAEQLQQRMVSVNGSEIQIVAPVDEFICLYFQYQAKRSQGIEHKVREYAEQLERLMDDEEVVAWVRDACGAPDRDQIRLRAFEPHEWQIFGYALLRRRWGRMTAIRFVAAQLRASLIRVKFLLPRLGPMVYFSGPDGAGKTTLTDGIKARLLGCGVQFMYLYSLKLALRGITKRLAFVKRIGRGKTARDEYLASEGVPDILFLTEDTRDRDTGSAFWRFRKRIALLVGIVDIWIGWCLVLPARLRGRIVLVETSPYDLFIKYHMPEFPGIESILGPLLPRPTIGFLLQADPHKIVERKAELTVEEIQDYYTRFDRALGRCRANNIYRILRTDTGPQTTAAHAFQMVTALAA